MTDLGFYGLGLNDSDQVVGLGGGCAMLYSEGVVYDLNVLLSHNSGWQLYYANSINNRGEITGFGFYRGNDRAFLLTPVKHPKP